MAKRGTLLLALLGLMLLGAGMAAAATITSSLFGGAVAEQSDVKLVSDLTDTSTANDFSGIAFTLPAGTTFADLTRLSTDFNPTVGGCGGGSPRFSIVLASGQNVVVQIGPSPSFTGCPLNTWQSSGNLIGNNDAGRYDLSHVGGSPFTTYAAALALVGSQQVKEIDLIVDSGWFFSPKTETVLVRNVQIDDQTFFAPTGIAKPNPARLCKADLAARGKDGFESHWGSNHNLRNAFGKCVEAMAHQHH